MIDVNIQIYPICSKRFEKWVKNTLHGNGLKIDFKLIRGNLTLLKGKNPKIGL
jgi:hypothetical protein